MARFQRSNRKAAQEMAKTLTRKTQVTAEHRRIQPLWSEMAMF